MQSYSFSVYDGKWRTCANSHPHRCHKVFAVQGSGWQLCIQTGEGMFHQFCKYFLESRLSLNPIVNFILFGLLLLVLSSILCAPPSILQTCIGLIASLLLQSSNTWKVFLLNWKKLFC
jgi:hypothetical protein